VAGDGSDGGGIARGRRRPQFLFLFFIALTSGLEIDNQCILQQTLKNITILYDLNIKSWFFEI
jgi:hypothetical protein